MPLPELADGSHTVTVTLTGLKGSQSRTESLTWMVDATPPALTAPAEVTPPPDGAAIEVAGLLSSDVVAVTVNGQALGISGGAYRASVAPTIPSIELVAIDAAGNEARRSIAVTTAPKPAEYPMTSAVHVGQSAWADPERREGILNMIREGRINAVQLDIKDEAGDIGYPTEVALAREIGAKMDFYDVREALDLLHSMKVRVIGRVVCFLDPTLAKWSWANGKPDNVILDATGAAPLPSESYGDAAFTNLASPTVQQYAIDLAVEGARLGFDEIIYDYVRRPEGDVARMQFPGITEPPEVTLARFVERSKAALEPSGTELGLSLFGVAATRPENTAQDVRLLGPLVDFIAPMIYPALWGDGEYGVAKPWKEPYEIVKRSLVDWHAVTDGSGAAIVPWLQDFAAGRYEYNAFDVATQIDGARNAGSTGYLMWNPKSKYHTDGITMFDGTPATPLTPPVDPAVSTSAPPPSTP